MFGSVIAMPLAETCFLAFLKGGVKTGNFRFVKNELLEVGIHISPIVLQQTST